MRAFIITLAFYILAFPFLFSFLSLEASLLGVLIITVLTLFYFRKNFSFTLKFDLVAIFTGILIAFIWVVIDGIYPHLAYPEVLPYTSISIITKLIISIVIAPIIEEFFTRFFLMRFVISKNWQKVPLGKYSIKSFIVTVLFFGLSHNRWLAGIITGVVLNVLLYKRKKIESCILAHAVANTALAIYVIYTNSWFFW